MAEYIERDAFLEEKRKLYCENCKRRYGLKKGKSVVCYEIGDAPCLSCGIGDVLDDVEDFPAADVRPVVMGKWIYGGQKVINETFPIYICSNCKKAIPAEWERKCNFCPNCGARMEES